MVAVISTVGATVSGVSPVVVATSTVGVGTEGVSTGDVALSTVGVPASGVSVVDETGAEVADLFTRDVRSFAAGVSRFGT